jgi:hypothetical protein
MGGTRSTSLTPAEGAARPEGEGDAERVTLVPDFDPEAFARDSETRQRAAAIHEVSPLDDARSLHRAGDHESALFVLTHLLARSPDDQGALHLASECRTALERECLRAVGSESAILVLTLSPAELKEFALDSTSGFLISLMDGATSVESILDICGLPRLLALRHLRKLRERGIAALATDTLRPPPSKREGPKTTRPAVQEPRETAIPTVEEVTIDSGILPVGATPPALDAIPVLLVPRGDLDMLGLEPMAGRLARLVDENKTVRDIILDANMPMFDGMTLFEGLAADGVLTFV